MDAYVANLDRYSERRRWMEKTLGEAGIAFRRVRSIDGNRFSDRTVADLTATSVYKNSRFEIANIMTNRKIWRIFLRSPAEHCVIFEDDIHVGRDLKLLLDELDTGRIPFDVIKLETFAETTMLDRSSVHCGGRALHPLLGDHRGAGGYVINRRAARALLEVTRSLELPLDMFLFEKSHFRSNGLVVLQTVPAAVIQEQFLNPSPSGEFISSFLQRHLNKPTGMRKIFREAVRPFRQLAAGYVACRGVLAGNLWMRVKFE
jgi:glycosyl transferase, family 25